VVSCSPKFALGASLALLTCGGCSRGPGRIKPPSVNPASAAQAAFEQLDKNQDGQINDEELKSAPGLAAAKVAYDADQNGMLAKDEVESGIRRWAEGNSGAIAVPYIVQMDGRPLPNAQVKAIPEPFLGDALKPATGINGYLAVAPEDRPPNAPKLPMMIPGLYRIEITDPLMKIPAKYNSQTTLGLEVSSAMPLDQAVVWALKSH
jgi:hypothetical protein